MTFNDKSLYYFFLLFIIISHFPPSSFGSDSGTPNSSTDVANFNITNSPLSGLAFCLPLSDITTLTLSPSFKNSLPFLDLVSKS